MARAHIMIELSGRYDDDLLAIKRDLLFALSETQPLLEMLAEVRIYSVDAELTREVPW